MNDDLTILILISLGAFATVFLFIRLALPEIMILIRHQERRIDAVLNRQLLMDVNPRMAIIGEGLLMVFLAFALYALGLKFWGILIGALLALFLPNLIINHLETKRREKLNAQLVDGITSLASGVRAGLTLVQSFQLLVKNSTGPIKQEFAQLLREYELGVDLNRAMVNTSNRIGSSHYRLLFAAIGAHRERGGDMAQSLDRITDSIREIQRLEGKLQTLTAQGRNQAWMMAGMAIVVLFIGYMIAPEETVRVLNDPFGRVILLGAAAMITAGFLWIRNIMSVDI